MPRNMASRFEELLLKEARQLKKSPLVLLYLQSSSVQRQCGEEMNCELLPTGKLVCLLIPVRSKFLLFEVQN
jgi:hypothetical protein